jgi:uncharacterized ion transporter superfamily protein YfcC
METAKRSALSIGLKSFAAAAGILLALMIAAGALTRVIPAGSYDRVVQGGRTLVQPDSYRQVPRPAYPAWRWFTAPFEVLGGSDNLTVITIILFLVFIGGAFAVVEKGEVMRHALAAVVARFSGRKYVLMAVVMLFFMLSGGILGVYEEVVPLVVFVVPLAHVLGWDSLVGLGMSLLALAFGFSAAITNPFTVGVAQAIAGLPLFSGAWLRVCFFVATYVVVFLFVRAYARKVEADPTKSLVYREDLAVKAAHLADGAVAVLPPEQARRMRRAIAWLAGWAGGAVVFVLVVTRFPAVSTYAFPAVALLFLVAGVGAGFLAGMEGRDVLRTFAAGVLNILPAVILILMAMSVKQIIVSGGIMDTILHAASGWISGASSYVAAFLVYLATLVLEFFVGSASAKAFLMMPIVAPLADLVGITRQTAVLAYDIGDGFANMFYPSNALLLIALGLTVVGYPKWIRWTLKVQGIMFLVSMAFLALAVAVRFGPF